MGTKTRAMLGQFDAACKAADDLEKAATGTFQQHPDAEIITSLPCLGLGLGARVLGEIGDDPERFADARGLKAYARAAPITRASGKSLSVTRRRVKNDRLAAAGYVWAFSAITASPGAGALYLQRRDAGDYHAATLRRLFHKLLGPLRHPERSPALSLTTLRATPGDIGHLLDPLSPRREPLLDGAH